MEAAAEVSLLSLPCDQQLGIVSFLSLRERLALRTTGKAMCALVMRPESLAELAQTTWRGSGFRRFSCSRPPVAIKL